MVELDAESVEPVDQAEAEEPADLIQEKELMQTAEEVVIHPQQVLLKETMVVIHLQLIFKLLAAVVALVLLDQMVLNQDLVVLVVLVVMV